MGALALDQAAFSKPGGEQAVVRRRGNPIDLGHLGEQVMHDPILEAEVLSLFSSQLNAAMLQLKTATIHERKIVAHTISGSAKGIGAFDVADAAQSLELSPHNLDLIAPLEAEIIRTTDFIAGLTR